MMINDLELAYLLVQVHLPPSKINPLAHIHTSVDNMTKQGSSNRGSVRLDTSVVPILQELAFLTWTHQIYSSVRQIK